MTAVRVLLADDGRGLLTAREQEILVLLAEGLSAPEIGRPADPGDLDGQDAPPPPVRDDRAAAVAEGMRRRLLG